MPAGGGRVLVRTAVTLFFSAFSDNLVFFVCYTGEFWRTVVVHRDVERLLFSKSIRF